MTFLNLPNIITLARLLILTPLIICMVIWNKPGIAFWILVLAGISDGADGFIARMSRNYTELGVWLDAVADKVMLNSSYLLLGYMQVIPFWVVGVVVGRDTLIVSGVLVSRLLSIPLKIGPLFISKANSVIQIMLIALILAVAAWNDDIMFMKTFAATDIVTVIGINLIEGVSWVMAVTSILSVVFYGKKWLQAIMAAKHTLGKSYE